MRYVILDTETTGLSWQEGHRVIEIGCVELCHRQLKEKTFHHYLRPDRAIDPGALRVHGITEAFLQDKPRFQEIAQELKNFLKGATLVMHNAKFDKGFLENEFQLLGETEWSDLSKHCTIIDTLTLARQKHPGQKNNLDALSARYQIDVGDREKHGALKDAFILAKVYLAMTSGQGALSLEEKETQEASTSVSSSEVVLPVLFATAEEQSAHQASLEILEKQMQGIMLWKKGTRKKKN